MSKGKRGRAIGRGRPGTKGTMVGARESTKGARVGKKGAEGTRVSAKVGANGARVGAINM